jgi:hypothetical protein
MGELSAEVIMVEACLRDGAGGSLTAVATNGEGLDDVALRLLRLRPAVRH